MKFAVLLALWLLARGAAVLDAPAALANRWTVEAAFEHLAWSAGA